MIGQNRGFAAAARGTGPTLDVWADWPVGQDPAGDHRAVSADLLQAFAQPDAATRGWWLAEFSRERPFPPQQAVGFHLLDTMVHGWDVAVSIGVPVEFDDDLTAAVLKVARAVPDGPGRLQPNAAFRPGVPQPDDAAPLPRILAMLGRSPDWSPSSTGDETVQTD